MLLSGSQATRSVSEMSVTNVYVRIFLFYVGKPPANQRLQYRYYCL